jgi:hypothetical protein
MEDHAEQRLPATSSSEKKQKVEAEEVIFCIGARTLGMSPIIILAVSPPWPAKRGELGRGALIQVSRVQVSLGWRRGLRCAYELEKIGIDLLRIRSWHAMRKARIELCRRVFQQFRR